MRGRTDTGRGYFAGFAAEAGAGTRYRYRVDGAGPFPDPASRFQPDGPHGASEVVAPTWLYGRPDDMRNFVDQAHAHGIGVLLDVVYNHLGPEGNYLTESSPDYFTQAYSNEWGEAVNFDGRNSAAVREFFTVNAAYWIREFHLDGLRIDATQQIFDSSREHILAQIARGARAAAAGRTIVLIAENEPQITKVARRADRGGYGLDARWNHDQIANSTRGLRVQKLTTPGRYRAMTALLLLAPNTPMLFQGQEFASSKPFYYFADHTSELAKTVLEGRAQFLSQFRSLAPPEMRESLLDPGNPTTFQKCKLDFAEREHHAGLYALHKDLIRMRREDPVFRMQGRRGLDGAVLGDEAFVLRYFGGDGDDQLLLVNLGRDLHLDPAPEPLLAPPEGREWILTWSTEEIRYGGAGTYAPDTEENWRLPSHAAMVMRPSAPGNPYA